MEISYKADVDILHIRLSPEPFDYAEESEAAITHFTKDGRPALLEIQRGKAFLLGSLASLLQGKEVKLP